MRVRGLRLRLCLCGWWAIAPHTSPALPDAPLLEQQTDWLAPARSQLLRRAHIARRTAVLDLGTGHGAVVPELVRRSRGLVIALDRDLAGLREEAAFAGACRLGADARHVPIVDGALDLILSQLTLLWVSPLELAIAEIWRTLGPEGALLALEPDYGGMIEHPPEIRSRELWLRGLARAGADPYVGRKLPGLLADQGFEVHVSLFDSLVEPKLERFDFLEDLPFTTEERSQLAEIQSTAVARATPWPGAWSQVAHLPFFLITATKPAA